MSPIYSTMHLGEWGLEREREGRESLRGLQVTSAPHEIELDDAIDSRKWEKLCKDPCKVGC